MWIGHIVDILLDSGIKRYRENQFSPEGNFDTWELGTRWHLKHSELFYDLAEKQTFPSVYVSEVRIFQFFISIPYSFYISVVVYMLICRITLRRHCSILLEVQTFGAIWSLHWLPALLLKGHFVSYSEISVQLPL